MAERLFPADAVGGTPAYSGRGLRQLHTPFLAGATAARPFGALSGVRPGTSAATVTATATTWRCGLHAGVLDVQPAVEAGPYAYAVDEARTGNMAAADASNTRIDRIYVQLSDPAEANVAQTVPPSVTVRYLQGTPAATPVPPTLPARSMSLARITVPRQGGGAPTVTWEARGVPAAGGTLEYQTRDQMDADQPPLGYLGRVVATGAIYERVATAAAATSWLHVAGRPDASSFSKYEAAFWGPHSSRGLRLLSHGGRVFMEGAMSSVGEVTIDKDKVFIFGNIPPALAPKVTARFAIDINRTYGTVAIDPAGVVSFLCTAPTFKGVFEASVDGLSWLDPRLA